MFILVSYSNDPHVQDIFYHGKFKTMTDICKELESWADTYFNKRIAIIPVMSDNTYHWCVEEGFTVDMRYDNDDDCIYGVMGYYDDFRLTFCIAKV